VAIGSASSPERRRGRLGLRGAVLTALALAAAYPCGSARAQGAPAMTGPRAPSDDVGFVQLLLDLGLPVEAGREARRVEMRHGEDALPPPLGFRLGMALALVGEADAATTFLAEAAARGEPASAEKWQLATGVVMLRAGTLPQALHLFTRVEAFSADPAVRAHAQRLGCMGGVLGYDAAAARACVGRLAPKGADQAELDQLVERLGIDPGRRAVVGGIMSGIVPGLGQLTAGHAGDGFLALALNSASVAGLTLLVLDGALLDAALLAVGVSARYYLGNINNGAEAWRAAAQRRRHEAALRLVARFGSLSD
jgi:hypothetical protein